jgi:hypothetical protein
MEEIPKMMTVIAKLRGHFVPKWNKISEGEHSYDQKRLLSALLMPSFDSFTNILAFAMAVSRKPVRPKAMTDPSCSR